MSGRFRSTTRRTPANSRGQADDGGPALNILQVSARYAPYVGGTEIHTGEVATELARRGHRVTVLTTDVGNKLPPEEVIDGVRVIRVPAGPPRLDLYVAPKLGRVIEREPWEVERERWDVVHVQGYHTAVAPMALRSAHRAGIPTALTFHSGGHSSRTRNLIRPIHARLLAPGLRRCDLLIGVSQFEVDLFARRLGLAPDQIRLIPNGVSGSDLTPVSPPQPGSRPQSESQPGPHLLSVGRLQRYKGHQRAIRALPELANHHPDVRLTILGDGPYRPRLEQLAERLGVADRVTIDHIPTDERHRMGEIMASSSVALFLSEYESHGMAAHEALLAGVPTIVADSTALAELAAQGLARAVPPRATDIEVAAIIGRTLERPDPRASRSAGPVESTAQRPGLERLRHSWPTIARRIEAAYRDITGTGTGTGTGPRADADGDNEIVGDIGFIGETGAEAEGNAPGTTAGRR